MSKPIMLTDKMREVMRTMHRSYRTEETYIHWVKQFIRFHKGQDPTSFPQIKYQKIRVPVQFVVITYSRIRCKKR